MPSTHGSWQLQDLWMDSRKGNCVQKLGPLQLHETRSVTLHHGSYKNCSDGTEEKHADLLTFLEKARSAQKPVAYITTGGCAGRVNGGSVLGHILGQSCKCRAYIYIIKCYIVLPVFSKL